MSDRTFRIARGLLFTIDRDGAVRVWQPRRREHTRVPPEILPLLLQFGNGSGIADAAERAGIEFDDSVDEAVAHLVHTELLIPADAAPVAAAPHRIANARIDEIIDRGTFEELATGATVTGFARIDGRKVAVAAWEPGADGGTEMVLQLQEQVLADPCPVIYLLDRISLGRDPAEFVSARAVGRIYANQARLSGIAPQVAIVGGSLWRPAALLPVGCDVVIFIEGRGFVHIGDREIVKELVGEDVTQEALGGARMHAEVSGLCHLLATSSANAAGLARRYLALMPTHATAQLPITTTAPPPAISPAALDALVPDDADTPFAIGELVHALLDVGSPLELRPLWARELSTTLGRIEGVPVGVIANCSLHKAGILSVEASDKAARFIALCDGFGLPLIFLVDVLGFAIGSAAERAGIERAAGRLFSALANATVPKLTLVVRKAHTAGLFAMAGPAFDPDAFLALPSASISIFSERGTVSGAAALERQLEPEARDSLRAYLRVNRTEPALVANSVIPASLARDELATRLHLLRATPRARQRRPLPP